jgi:uncharacterized protein YndB with AHSA1/START domain
MRESVGRELRIERTFTASADEVFDAWTSPEVMRRWLHPGDDWETPVAVVDLRVGGEVRIVMRAANGRDHGARGEYRVIERPHRLVMSWTFDDTPANEQLIELTFSESGGATTVVMVNSGISTDARLESQDQGWRGCFDQYERLVSRNSTDALRG